MYNILDKLKKQKIDNYNMQILYEIVMNLDDATNIQKRRFLLYFGLMPDIKYRKTLLSIANEYGCTTTAVRNSLHAIVRKLISINDEEILQTLKNMSE